jgi:hypothetical protein
MAYVCNSAIPEEEVGGSWLETTLGKMNTRPYLKNKLKSKSKLSQA